jgi:hypothetical protein
MRTFREVERFAVTVVSPDDGHNIIIGYFRTRLHAEDAAQEKRGFVVPTKMLVETDTGEHFVGELKKVILDIPDRAAVLAKLTPAERAALGF